MTTPPPRPGPPRPGRRPSAPALDHDGRRARRRHPRARRPHRGGARPGARWPGWSASTATPRRWRWPASGWRRSATGSPACTRRTTRSPTCSPSSASPTSTASCSTSASPRCSSTSRERGFAYAEDAPLDMRMDRHHRHHRGRRAQHLPAADLTRVLREYGEEKFAPRIAAAVVRERESEPFTDLGAGWSSCCTPQIPAPARRTGGHPAKRTFQALRMEVNDELDVLAPGDPGRDRRRSASAAAWSWSPTTRSRTAWSSRRSPPSTQVDVPADLPFVPEGHEPALRLVTRGAEKAVEPEIADNPRAASVRLRAIERSPPPHHHPRSQQGSRADDPSTPHEQHRTSPPRPRPADRRGRRRARPADRRPGARDARPARCRSCSWSRCCCSAASSGCCSSTPRCSRRRSRRPPSSSRPTRSRPASRPCRWSSSELRDPQRHRAKARGWAWCCRDSPAVPRPAHGKVLGDPVPATPARPAPAAAPAPKKPAALDPPAHVTVVRRAGDPPATATNSTGNTARGSHDDGARTGRNDQHQSHEQHRPTSSH